MAHEALPNSPRQGTFPSPALFSCPSQRSLSFVWRVGEAFILTVDLNLSPRKEPTLTLMPPLSLLRYSCGLAWNDFAHLETQPRQQNLFPQNTLWLVLCPLPLAGDGAGGELLVHLGDNIYFPFKKKKKSWSQLRSQDCLLSLFPSSGFSSVPHCGCFQLLCFHQIPSFGTTF